MTTPIQHRTFSRRTLIRADHLGRRAALLGLSPAVPMGSPSEAIAARGALGFAYWMGYTDGQRQRMSEELRLERRAVLARDARECAMAW